MPIGMPVVKDRTQLFKTLEKLTLNDVLKFKYQKAMTVREALFPPYGNGGARGVMAGIETAGRRKPTNV